MRERYDLFSAEEYAYPGGFGFLPGLTPYLHGDATPRPAMLVIPGGAYCGVSPTEAEIVAKRFYDLGWQAFVLTYTTNPTLLFPLKGQPLREAARAVRLIRRRAEEFRVLDGKTAACGFSAGGHLCASLAVHWEDADRDDPDPDGISCRPDGAILSYPVISTSEFGHAWSTRALLGDDPDAGELRYWSLETQVTEKTPPCFLWHTATDEGVPPENSLSFARALAAVRVPYALHLFSAGPHGLSLANEDWAMRRYGGDYTLDLFRHLRDALEAGKIPDTEFIRGSIESGLIPWKDWEPDPGHKIWPEVAVWPELADTWLRERVL